jgi:uncharacterized repeat protein (TIGR03803 family)
MRISSTFALLSRAAHGLSLSSFLLLFEVLTAQAQTLSVVRSFTGDDGSYPYAPLTVSGRLLYGAAALGGRSNVGTVFKLNTDGTGFTVLKEFHDSDGNRPVAQLTLSDGVLYGTTQWGGEAQAGTVFRLNTDGTGFSVLKHFTLSDGMAPYGRLLLAQGTLYGTTRLGGNWNTGTVFSVNTDGSNFTVLKHFSGVDGWDPFGGLVLSGGTLYGTTRNGGLYDMGTVYKVNTNGTGFATVWTFDGAPLSDPSMDLVLSGNTLYGAAPTGLRWGFVFKVNTDGTGFALLKDFPNDTGEPQGQLLLVGNTLYGASYGTAYQGTTADFGAIFKLKTDGTDFAVLARFSFTNGSAPTPSLALATNAFYVTTTEGGSAYDGVIARLDPPAPVFLSATKVGGSLQLTWSAMAGIYYQLQYTTNLGQTPWLNAGDPIQATDDTLSALVSAGPDPRRFYRVALP